MRRKEASQRGTSEERAGPSLAGSVTGVRAQLNLLVAATTAVVLAAFLAPLGIVLRNTTQQRAVAEATARAQTAATLVALGQVPTGESLTVVYGDDVADRASVELARQGEAFSAWTSGGVEALVPVLSLIHI